jgi:ribosomal protein S12 methylthiotransferase
MSAALKVALVSLGCPKNLVDSERILGALAAAGYEIVEENEQAEVIIVNTCAFIRPAEEEAVEALLDLADLKAGMARAVICVGCLTQRRGGELMEALPEVDGFAGVGVAARMPEIVARVLAGERVFVASDLDGLDTAAAPRWRSAPEWSTYLKIADGCSNHCTYCTIPLIRGPFRSRPMADVVSEFRQLVAGGVQEVCLIAQDTAMYGTDLSGRVGLPDLLRELGEVPFDGWLRVMYMHPEHVTDDLLATMAATPQVVPYLDLPLQHVAKNVLFRMGRKGTKEECLALVRRVRDAMPDAALRTTFMTGFPQETEGDFEALLDFLDEARLDRVSAFRYWAEEGTPAAQMPNQIPEEVRDERLARLLAAQEMISLEVNQRFVGQRLRVLVEECVEGVFKGRSYRDAPEVDGEVKIVGAPAGALSVGEFAEVEITRAEVHDLEGTLLPSG